MGITRVDAQNPGLKTSGRGLGFCFRIFVGSASLQRSRPQVSSKIRLRPSSLRLPKILARPSSSTSRTLRCWISLSRVAILLGFFARNSFRRFLRSSSLDDEHPRDASRTPASLLSDVPSAAFCGHLQHQSLDGPQGLGRQRRRAARHRCAAMGGVASHAHPQWRLDRAGGTCARSARSRLHRQRRRGA